MKLKEQAEVRRKWLEGWSSISDTERGSVRQDDLAVSGAPTDEGGG